MYYKTPNNLLYFLEDESFVNTLPKNSVKITDEEAKVIITKQEQEALQSLTYAQKRIGEYPPITDYIDGVVKNDQKQINKYIADCLAVKAKYPKP